jgi:hypothetical protein
VVDIAAYADLIVAHAKSDGALVSYDPSQSPFLVQPYFANIAVAGPVDAYRATKDKRYIAAGKSWVTWYLNQAEPKGGIIDDYTGTPENWEPASPIYDSVDSYIATFIRTATLVAGYVTDDAAWRQRLINFMPTALGVLSKVLQKNGPVTDLFANLLPSDSRGQTCYLEDNCEVLQSLSYIAGFFSIPGLDPKAQSPKTANAINTVLFDSGASPFARDEVGKELNGASDQYAPFLQNFYPGQQAQLMALETLNHPRLAQLWANMKTYCYPQVPAVIGAPHGLDDFDMVVWWGLAALRWETPQSDFFKAVTNRLLAYDPGVGPWIHDLGRACTVLARLNPGLLEPDAEPFAGLRSA